MPAKRKDPDELYERITFTMPPEQAARLRNYCQKEERSMSWVLQKSIDEYINRHCGKEEK